MTSLDTAAPDQFEVWNGALGAHWAAHHARYDAMLAEFDRPLFEAAAIKPIDRVLDVGCGAGATTREAAQGVSGGSGRLRGGLARTSAALSSVADAPRRLPPPPCSCTHQTTAHVAVQGAVVRSRPDPPNTPYSRDAAGRSAWTSRPRCSPWRGPTCCRTSGTRRPTRRRTLPRGRLRRLHQPGRRDVTAAAHHAMASLAEPERLRAVLADFDGVAIRPVHAASVYGRNTGDAVDFVLSRGPHREVSAEVRAAMAEVFAPYAGPLGVRLPSSVWLVTGKRPAAPRRA